MSLTNAQALDMLRSDDLIGIGMEADVLRKRLHPGNVITYQIDRNINYTNVCTEYCSFCAFYRPVGSPEGYVQPLESIYQKIDETLDRKSTRLNSSHRCISYAVFCLKKKINNNNL